MNILKQNCTRGNNIALNIIFLYLLKIILMQNNFWRRWG